MSQTTVFGFLGVAGISIGVLAHVPQVVALEASSLAPGAMIGLLTAG